MRKILFRGKRIDNGEWIEGDILTSVSYPDKVYVTECKTYFDRELSSIGFREVFSITVGQFTGMCDKNGTKIFEGDIVKDTGLEVKNIYEIKWDNEDLKFEAYSVDDGIEMNLIDVDGPALVIIGNIFDNPELFKVFSV